MPVTPESRRELSVRNTDAAQKAAAWLSQKDIEPNQISLASIACAIAGFYCLMGYDHSQISVLLLLGAVFIQLRLLCNLFDGMVAIEGGKKTSAGELFNDLPDRIADPLFIVGAGFVALEGHEWLGWLCALLAVLTAYIRVLGVSMGCPADFQGPMAKQHRMALLTASLILMFVLNVFGASGDVVGSVMSCTLFGMMIALSVTCYKRISQIIRFKEQEQLNV